MKTSVWARRFAKAASVVALSLSCTAAQAVPSSQTSIGTSVTVGSALTVYGNVTLGDAGTDTVTVAGTVTQQAGQYKFASGSATAPGLSFGYDANTGMYSSSASGSDTNSLFFATDGLERLSIDASGNLSAAGSAAFGSVKSAAYLDSNGATVLALAPSPSSPAVNYFTMRNANAGFLPTLQVSGTDSDISMYVFPKGSGSVVISNGVTNADQFNLKAQTAVTDAGAAGTLTTANLSATRTWTLPDASGTVLMTDGSGASLTALNASNISSGTLDAARLPSAIVIDADTSFRAQETHSLTIDTTGTGTVNLGGVSGHAKSINIGTGSGVQTISVGNDSSDVFSLTSSGLNVSSTGVITGASGSIAQWSTGTVAIANGGTGATTANAALNALLPSQSSAAGKYLVSDGTNTSWSAPSTMPTYTNGGTAVAAPHTVIGSATISGGGSTSVSLSGSAAFTSSTSYVCNVSATALITEVVPYVQAVSGSSFTVYGDASEPINYVCVGN